MTRRRLASLLVAALFAVLRLAGAVPSTSSPWDGLATMAFSHQPTLQETVLCILQDRSGLVWFGTYTGLVRWDGYRERRFTHDAKDPASLPNNFVTAMRLDREGNLVVATGGGVVARYDPGREAFLRLPASETGTGLTPALAADKDGGVWLGNSNGLSYLAQGATAWQRVDLPRADRVLSLLADREGGLWIGTAHGLFHRNRNGGPLALQTGAGGLAAEAPISALLQDHAGAIWLGTTDGEVGRVGGLKAQMPASGGAVVALAEALPGVIGVGMDGSGIAFLEGDTGRRLFSVTADPARSTGLADSKIYDLLVGRSGELWVAHVQGADYTLPANDGLLTLQPSDRDHSSLSGKLIYSVFPRPDGKVWFGSENGGADLFDPKSGRLTTLPRKIAGDEAGLPAAQIRGFAQGEKGEVWIATTRGLFRSDGRSVRRFDPLGDDPVWSILRDGDDLWVGLRNGGLVRLNLIQGGLTTLVNDPSDPASLSDNFILDLKRDSKAGLWVATPHGLNLYDGKKFHRFLHDDADPASLPDDSILSLLIDRKGRLWLGTTGGGVALLEGEPLGEHRFRHFGLAEGLPNESVSTVLEDHQGQIWAATQGAVAEIDPDTFAIRSFGIADGAILSSYWGHSGGVAADGTVMFGGGGGVALIHPERLSEWHYQPPVLVTALRAGGRNLPSSASVTLPPEDHSLQVEFAALDYSAPDRNRYAYRLRGFDEQWNDVDSNHRLAAYTNLPPGSYVFEMRGSNRNGQWTEPPTELAVTVRPAWYQTWWCRTLEALAALLAIAGFVRLRTARLHAQSRALEEKVAAQTAELRHAVDLAEKANAAKRSFLANMSHEIRTPINAIVGYLDLALGGKDEVARQGYLQKIDGATRLLRGVINDLLDFSKIEAGYLTLESIPFRLSEAVEMMSSQIGLQAAKKGLKLSTEIGPDVPDWLIGDPIRLGQVLINLGSNAVKFTEHGEVALRVTLGGQSADWVRLDFAVRDTGLGMSEAEMAKLFTPFTQADSSTTRKFGGTGLGLAISQAIIGMMHGKITVESRPRQGSTFSFSIEMPLASDVGPGKEATGGFEILEKTYGRLPGVRVLLTEDNAINQQLARELLEREGAEVTIVGNGREAVSVLEGDDWRSYDAVLLDLQMPEMDGYQAAAAIRKTVPAAILPLIALTAHAMREERDRCLAVGMQDHVIKPIDPDLLANVLARWIGPQRMAAAAARPRAQRENVVSPPVELPASLPGIDLEAGLRGCAGNSALYLDLLGQFYRDYGESGLEADRLCREGKQREAYVLVHTIKGASANLGMVALREAAMALEATLQAAYHADAGMMEDAEAESWREAMPAFIDALDLVQTGLGELLG